jgi:hypothetical protein
MKNCFFSVFMLLIISALIMTGCKQDDEYYDQPDTDSLEADFEFVRFDQHMVQIDGRDPVTSLRSLYDLYPNFSELYFKEIIGLDFSPESDELLLEIYQDFILADPIVAIQDTVSERLGTLGDIEEELRQAFKNIKYYFPEFVAPNIYTYISEFAYQKFIFEDLDRDGIGIGLDMFLGSDFNYKALDPTNPSFSDYLTRSFSREYIVKNVLDLIIDDIIGEAPGIRMIDFMIHNGKKLYLMGHFLPAVHDTIRYDFSLAQMEWLRQNELEMWSFFLDENLFYETNFSKINKYVNLSPNSPKMPQRAPGRTANFIGLQMVKSYMRRNPQFTLLDLIQMRDSQKLMESSNYKPKRRK